jgi:hypothetical protein
MTNAAPALPAAETSRIVESLTKFAEQVLVRFAVIMSVLVMFYVLFSFDVRPDHECVISRDLVRVTVDDSSVLCRMFY